MDGRGIGMRTAGVRPDAVAGRNAGTVEDEALIDAAWAALLTGQPRELQTLDALLGRAMAEGCREALAGAERAASLRRLELLLASTARNLRVMRGQWRMG
jgi:hypothetical protein